MRKQSLKQHSVHLYRVGECFLAMWIKKEELKNGQIRWINDKTGVSMCCWKNEDPNATKKKNASRSSRPASPEDKRRPFKVYDKVPKVKCWRMET